MKEVTAIQAKHEDLILIVQVGHFYEVYDHHTYLDEVCSLLNIKLITRKFKRGLVRSAGFPVKEAERYINILVANNKAVGLVDQIGKDSQSLSKREIRGLVRIFSPGTLISQESLTENVFLLAIHASERNVSCAWADITTGEFECASISNISDTLLKVSPKEVLIDQQLESTHEQLFDELLKLSSSLGFKLTVRKSKVSSHSFSDFIKSKSQEKFVEYDSHQKKSGSMILDFVAEMFPGLDSTRNFNVPRHQISNSMILGGSVLKTLELSMNMDGGVKNTLIHTLNKTQTAAGSRLFKSRISNILKIITIMSRVSINRY